MCIIIDGTSRLGFGVNGGGILLFLSAALHIITINFIHSKFVDLAGGHFIQTSLVKITQVTTKIHKKKSSL